MRKFLDEGGVIVMYDYPLILTTLDCGTNHNFDQSVTSLRLFTTYTSYLRADLFIRTLYFDSGVDLQ